MKIESILKLVSETFGVTESDLMTRARTENLAFARQVAMSFIYDYTALSLKETGALFKRNHGTTLWAINSVKDRVQTDNVTAAKVGLLRAALVEGARAGG